MFLLKRILLSVNVVYFVTRINLMWQDSRLLECLRETLSFNGIQATDLVSKKAILDITNKNIISCKLFPNYLECLREKLFFNGIQATVLVKKTTILDIIKRNIISCKLFLQQVHMLHFECVLE